MSTLKDDYFNSTIKDLKEVFSEVAKTDIVKRLESDIMSVSVAQKMFMIDPIGDLYFIPTGTVDKPAGIASFDGGYIAIFDGKDYLQIVSKKNLREIIKNNRDQFDRCTGPDFKTMGFKINKTDFESLLES